MDRIHLKSPKETQMKNGLGGPKHQNCIGFLNVGKGYELVNSHTKPYHFQAASFACSGRHLQ
jgi:hypothetical protein